MRNVKLKGLLIGGCLLDCPNCLSAATMVVDWLEFRPLMVGPERQLIGSDHLGRDLVKVRIESISGILVPESPSAGELSGESWLAETLFTEVDGSGAGMTTFQTQVAGSGQEANYRIEVDFLSPTVGVALGVGQIFSFEDGGTGMVSVFARNASMEGSTIPPPSAFVGWDNGVIRNTLPLVWNPTAQSLGVASQDPQARNSEFAFFNLGSLELDQVRFEIPDAYPRGGGRCSGILHRGRHS